MASLLFTTASGTQVSLAALIRRDLIFVDLPATNRDEVLAVLADRLSATGTVPVTSSLAQHLLERERLGSTGIGGGVAIPHCKLNGLRHAVVAVARTAQGVDFAAIDGEPVRVLFVVVSPTAAPAEHLQILAAISRWIRPPQHVAALLGAPDREAIYHLLVEEA